MLGDESADAGRDGAAQAETIGEAEQITFTAKVGTKELYRNQSRISLDAAIYIKDDYAMLPLRAFSDLD
mgnify:CR=1 FL=1